MNLVIFNFLFIKEFLKTLFLQNIEQHNSFQHCVHPSKITFFRILITHTRLFIISYLINQLIKTLTVISVFVKPPTGTDRSSRILKTLLSLNCLRILSLYLIQTNLL